MRFFFTLFVLILYTGVSHAQGGTWVWVKGSDTTIAAHNAVFGTQGVASIANNPPDLYEAACWTDLQGNFWIFGGVDSQAHMGSDLWKYTPSVNMWTWVNGPGVFNE